MQQIAAKSAKGAKLDTPRAETPKLIACYACEDTYETGELPLCQSYVSILELHTVELRAPYNQFTL
ncbi:hypothetical protein QR506_25065, partial [Escherichia coli]